MAYVETEQRKTTQKKNSSRQQGASKAPESVQKLGEVIAKDVSQIEATLSNVREQASATITDLSDFLGNIVPFISSLVQTGMDRVCETTLIDMDSSKHGLFDSFIWASLCIGSLGVGEFVGHNSGTASVMSGITGQYTAQVLAMVVLPFLFYQSVKEKGHANKRFSLLVLSFFLGLLSGYAYSLASRKVEMGVPPSLVLPLVMALVTEALPPGQMGRQMYVGSVVGTCAIINIMLAVSMNQLDNSFFMEIILTLLVSVLNVQLTCFAVRDGSGTAAVNNTLVWVMSTQMLHYVTVHFFTGSGKQEQ